VFTRGSRGFRSCLPVEFHELVSADRNPWINVEAACTRIPQIGASPDRQQPSWPDPSMSNDLVPALLQQFNDAVFTDEMQSADDYEVIVTVIE
jgi:hypothetical protein